MKTLTRGRTHLGLRSFFTLLRIYNALARSRIDYGAVMLCCLPKYKFQLVETTQNTLLRAILGRMSST